MPVRRFGRMRGKPRGTATVEFVMTMPMVLLLFVGIFEFSRHYYVRLNVRNAVAEAARFAATGQTLLDAEGEEMTRAESIVSVIISRARGLNLDVDGIVIEPADGGGPDEIVRIQAGYRFEFMAAPLIGQFAPPVIEFTVATTFKNEPVF